MLGLAITRKPGPNFASGITASTLGLPDYERALQQHEVYCDALHICGLDVVVLEPDVAYPDGCFVEDTAVIAGEVAIITQPGHPSRLGEQEFISEILQRHLPIEKIAGEGRVDGGDILHAGNHYFIGRSNRTNAEGARQLASLLIKYGFTTSEVPVEQGLHLKSSASYLGNNTMVVAPAFASYFEDFHLVDTGEEEYAANCVLINDYLLFPAGFPGTKDKLFSHGYKILEVEMSEFRKMDGGLTCLSLLLQDLSILRVMQYVK